MYEVYATYAEYADSPSVARIKMTLMGGRWGWRGNGVFGGDVAVCALWSVTYACITYHSGRAWNRKRASALEEISDLVEQEKERERSGL